MKNIKTSQLWRLVPLVLGALVGANTAFAQLPTYTATPMPWFTDLSVRDGFGDWTRAGMRLFDIPLSENSHKYVLLEVTDGSGTGRHQYRVLDAESTPDVSDGYKVVIDETRDGGISLPGHQLSIVTIYEDFIYITLKNHRKQEGFSLYRCDISVDNNCDMVNGELDGDVAVVPASYQLLHTFENTSTMFISYDVGNNRAFFDRSDIVERISENGDQYTDYPVYMSGLSFTTNPLQVFDVDLPEHLNTYSLRSKNGLGSFIPSDGDVSVIPYMSNDGLGRALLLSPTNGVTDIAINTQPQLSLSNLGFDESLDDFRNQGALLSLSSSYAVYTRGIGEVASPNTTHSFVIQVCHFSESIASATSGVSCGDWDFYIFEDEDRASQGIGLGIFDAPVIPLFGDIIIDPFVWNLLGVVNPDWYDSDEQAQIDMLIQLGYGVDNPSVYDIEVDGITKHPIASLIANPEIFIGGVEVVIPVGSFYGTPTAAPLAVDSEGNAYWLTLGGTASVENTVSLNPSATLVDPNIDAQLSVAIDVEASDLYGLQVSCTSDPSIISLVSSFYGDLFDPSSRLEIPATLDAPNLGDWAGAMSLRSPALPVTGAGNFATLDFVAQPTSGTTDVSCVALGSDINGNPISFNLISTTIEVDDGIHAQDGAVLTGNVTLPNGTDHSGTEVTLTYGDYILTTTTDADGNYSFTDLRNGNFAVSYNAPRHVGECSLAKVSGLNDQMVAPSVLIPGDINDDDMIDIADFTILAAKFGSSEGENRYKLKADLNQDSTIDILDLSILGSHFGMNACAGDSGSTGPVAAGDFSLEGGMLVKQTGNNPTVTVDGQNIDISLELSSVDWDPIVAELDSGEAGLLDHAPFVGYLIDTPLSDQDNRIIGIELSTDLAEMIPVAITLSQGIVEQEPANYVDYMRTDVVSGFIGLNQDLENPSARFNGFGEMHELFAIYDDAFGGGSGSSVTEPQFSSMNVGQGDIMILHVDNGNVTLHTIDQSGQYTGAITSNVDPAALQTEAQLALGVGGLSGDILTMDSLDVSYKILSLTEIEAAVAQIEAGGGDTSVFAGARDLAGDVLGE